MKVWRSVRSNACASARDALRRRRLVGPVGVAAAPDAGAGAGRRVMVQTKRSQRSSPVTRRASGRSPRRSSSLSATGACTSAKWRPTLSSGAQCDGRQTASHGMRRARAVDHREVLGEGEAEQRQRARQAGGKAASSAPIAGVAVAAAADRRRAPSRAAARRSGRSARRGRERCRACRARPRRRWRAAPARRRSRRRRASACVGGGRRAPPASRADARPLGALGVSCAVPGAMRRRPGCIRNGAVTGEKSKAMTR